MNPESRRAWKEIVTPEDYERHMADVGQAQAAALLTRSLVRAASLPEGARVVVVGAGTGQMLDYLEAGLLRPFRLTFTDLNPSFLVVLRKRLSRHHLEATVVEDDLERTRLERGSDLILATLVLEHIDWRHGVKVLTGLRPLACGIVIQENPPGMASALTPGRKVPKSFAKAMEIAHPTLIPRDSLIEAMAHARYPCRFAESIPVADRKRIIGMLFRQGAKASV